MNRLWSPWRSQYIESFNNKKENNSCIFCAAIKESCDENKSLKIYEAKNCYVMLNLYPYNSGHLLIIPHQHTANLLDINPEENSEIMETVKLSMQALNIVMSPHGFNFGANLGKAAGAGIDEHIHFHIVPRWNGDTNFMPSIGEVKVISQDLLVTKEKLINAFKQLNKK